jgi:hypothetical protein
MRRSAGGNRVNTAIGAGLTAGLFLFGLALVGACLVLDELLGGVEEGDAAARGAGRAGPAPRPSGGTA